MSAGRFAGGEIHRVSAVTQAFARADASGHWKPNWSPTGHQDE